MWTWLPHFSKLGVVSDVCAFDILMNRFLGLELHPKNRLT
jgi:hypothetical protein